MAAVSTATMSFHCRQAKFKAWRRSNPWAICGNSAAATVDAWVSISIPATPPHPVTVALIVQAHPRALRLRNSGPQNRCECQGDGLNLQAEVDQSVDADKTSHRGCNCRNSRILRAPGGAA